MKEKIEEIEEDVKRLLTDALGEEKIPKHLIRQFSICYFRWLEAEEKNSQLGLLAKHSNGMAIESPYVKISLAYMKQANEIWDIIQNQVEDISKKMSYKKFMEVKKYEYR